MKSRAIALWIVVVALCGFALWTRPLIVYRVTVLPELADRADGLRPAVVREFERPGPDWMPLRVANLSLVAPIAVTAARCAPCANRCRLPLDEGRLAIFPDRAPADLGEVHDRFVPSSADLHWWQPPSRNWSTVQALVHHARGASNVEAFRFTASGSRGVVIVHGASGEERFVVYAYGAEGQPTRVVGLSNISRDALHRVLGSLVVTTGSSDVAVCRSPSEAPDGPLGPA